MVELLVGSNWLKRAPAEMNRHSSLSCHSSVSHLGVVLRNTVLRWRRWPPKNPREGGAGQSSHLAKFGRGDCSCFHPLLPPHPGIRLFFFFNGLCSSLEHCQLFSPGDIKAGHRLAGGHRQRGPEAAAAHPRQGEGTTGVGAHKQELHAH